MQLLSGKDHKKVRALENWTHRLHILVKSPFPQQLSPWAPWQEGTLETPAQSSSDLCRTGERCFLPHPYRPILSPFKFYPLFCADLGSEEFRCQESNRDDFCGKETESLRRSWSLLLWSQSLAEERCWSGLVLRVPSSTFLGDQGCVNQLPH